MTNNKLQAVKKEKKTKKNNIPLIQVRLSASSFQPDWQWQVWYLGLKPDSRHS